MTTRTRELYVEFQPDLKRPSNPVPLGVLVLTEDDGGGHSWVVLGREPRPDNRPPEFEKVPDLGFMLTSGWIDSFAKDLSEDVAGDPIDRICGRWRWNLYATAPIETKLSAQETTLARALKLYESHTGVRFDETKLRLRPRKKPPTRIVRRRSPIRVTHYREEVIQRAATG